MKRIVIAFLLMALAIAECGAQQTVENVIRRSRAKSALVRSGHYVMQQKFKYFSEPDTFISTYTCDFKKMPADTLFGMRFFMRAEFKEYPNVHFRYLYTGNEYVAYDDTTGTIYSCDKWSELIKRENRDLYKPITSPNRSVLPSDKSLADSNRTFTMSDVFLDGKPCYKVNILVKPEDKPNDFGTIQLRFETNLWIDKQDYMLVQYSVAFDEKEGRDTLHQYEECKLLSFSPVADESKFALESIPSSVTLKNYVPRPYNAPEPLAVGSRAPDWSLPSLDGDTVRLADLKGKVVLIDFFYKSCAPCCAALPKLHSLHEKYKDRGFVMIGIDPIDNPKKDKMSDFLSKRDITYTVLFSDRQLPQTYRVQGYPTLFFLDREGKIAKIHVGFSTNMEAEIEEQLLKMLE